MRIPFISLNMKLKNLHVFIMVLYIKARKNNQSFRPYYGDKFLLEFQAYYSTSKEVEKSSK